MQFETVWPHHKPQFGRASISFPVRIGRSIGADVSDFPARFTKKKQTESEKFQRETNRESSEIFQR